MKIILKSFKELKGYIDMEDSDKVLDSENGDLLSIDEDATDAFINAQREVQEDEKPSTRPDSVSDIERRYIWLSKGG